MPLEGKPLNFEHPSLKNSAGELNDKASGELQALESARKTGFKRTPWVQGPNPQWERVSPALRERLRQEEEEKRRLNMPVEKVAELFTWLDTYFGEHSGTEKKVALADGTSIRGKHSQGAGTIIFDFEEHPPKQKKFSISVTTDSPVQPALSVLRQTPINPTNPSLTVPRWYYASPRATLEQLHKEIPELQRAIAHLEEAKETLDTKADKEKVASIV